MTYSIVATSALEALTKEQQTALFKNLIQDSMSTVRKSVDGTQTIVKWDGETCPLDAFSIVHTDYPDVKVQPAGVKVEMNKPEWDNE